MTKDGGSAEFAETAAGRINAANIQSTITHRNRLLVLFILTTTLYQFQNTDRLYVKSLWEQIQEEYFFKTVFTFS